MVLLALGIDVGGSSVKAGAVDVSEAAWRASLSQTHTETVGPRSASEPIQEACRPLTLGGWSGWHCVSKRCQQGP